MIKISCSGKFWAFTLAQQLEKRDLLKKLYTGYYSRTNGLIFRLGAREDREKFSQAKVTTFPVLSILAKFTKKHYEINEIFDFLVASHLSKTDDYRAFIGWSGMSLRSMMKVKEKGKLAILERGSSHIIYQSKILQEEYRRFGVDFNMNNKVIEKELKEYDKADFICVPSEFVKSSFIKYGIDEKKLFKNPFGADISIFKPDMDQFDDSINNFKVVYLGGLTMRKGLYYLFEALKDVKLPNFEVWYIGYISDEMKTLLKKYKNDNWKFYGHVNHYNLPDILSRCSIGVQPSLEEGLSMVIPQMLACGIPVIASTNTGGEDLIKEGCNGFIVPIRSPEAIRERILTLYEDRALLHTMKRNALEMSQNNFTWDQYGERYVRFLSNFI